MAQQFYQNFFMRIIIGSALMIFLDLLIEPIAPVLDFWAFEGGKHRFKIILVGHQ